MSVPPISGLKDFYELAAFSHGLNTYIKGYGEADIAMGHYDGFDKKSIGSASIAGRLR